MYARTKRKPLAEINVVPYIDVMLVLLVIFMITAPMLTQGVKVDLPKASTEAVQAQEALPIIVTVDKKGAYYINHENQNAVELNQDSLLIKVVAELKLAAIEKKKRQVLVRGDKEVEYGKVITLMALLKKAGVEKVGLMTESMGNDEKLS
jgi:biopolymer transport protein TolR